MVESMSPDYYAANIPDDGFILTGLRLDRIPSDAIGIGAYSNDNPLGGIDSTQQKRLYHIVEQSASSLVLANNDGGVHAQDCYLGAIVSADRSTVYWVNFTEPLP